MNKRTLIEQFAEEDPELFFQEQTEVLEDKFIEYFANEYDVHPNLVADALKHCIIKIKKKFPEYDVYDVVMSLFDIQMEEMEEMEEFHAEQAERDRIKSLISKTITSKTLLQPTNLISQSITYPIEYYKSSPMSVVKIQPKIISTLSTNKVSQPKTLTVLKTPPSRKSNESTSHLISKLITVTLPKKATICQQDYVTFEGNKVPTQFPDANLMNIDPDKYIINKKMSTADLDNLVKVASYLHFNYGCGGLSDNTFDAFEYILNSRLKTKGRRYDKIGAQPIERIRAKLPYFMPSLEKVKPGTNQLIKYLSNHLAKNLIWSDKLDGVSACIIYKKGNPTKLYTRGTGVIGGDISYLIEHIFSIPVLDETVNHAVRGELIISKKEWIQLISKTCVSYSNPRSYATATVNSGTINKSTITHISFVAYSIIDDGMGMEPKPTAAFKWLKKYGFLLPKWGILSSPTTFNIIDLYKKNRDDSKYIIDGLVLAYDVDNPVLTNINDCINVRSPTKVAF